MKIRELLAQLEGLDPEREVILQKDAEGNGYSPCAGLGLGAYVADSTYSGEVIEVPSYEAPDELGAPCVVLYPVN